MKKLLWVGDAGVPSGFGRATHEILDRVCGSYDVTVLAINYRGDPHPYPYPIYAAAAGGDSLGVSRLIWMCRQVKPDAIVFQNDGWFIPYYVAALRRRKPSGEYVTPEYAAIPLVASLAVDGKNFYGDWIKDISLTVFWTQFGLNEARIGGFAGRAEVIPLGVDTSVFYPVAREGALERQKATALRDKFIVGNINRNQYRKRWDLTIKYFAEWVKSRGVTDAELFLHCAPTGDESVNVEELARYYEVVDMLALREPEIFYGNSDEDMRDTYSLFDVAISTSQGEGFGLTTLEAMACGTPCVVPAWAAYTDWAKGAVAAVPCTSTALNSIQTLNKSAVIGGIADEKKFIEALDLLYRDKAHREMVATLGLERARHTNFSWDTIGGRWIAALDALLAEPEVVDDEIWQEVNPAQALAGTGREAGR